jgi:hypothetical protein
MTAEDQNTPAISIAQSPRGTRVRLGEIARRGLARLVPAYARYRARNAAVAAALARVEFELSHVSKRHAEQIERLEDLVGELVLAVESLRRRVASREGPADT